MSKFFPPHLPDQWNQITQQFERLRNFTWQHKKVWRTGQQEAIVKDGMLLNRAVVFTVPESPSHSHIYTLGAVTTWGCHLLPPNTDGAGAGWSSVSCSRVGNSATHILTTRHPLNHLSPSHSGKQEVFICWLWFQSTRLNNCIKGLGQVCQHPDKFFPFSFPDFWLRIFLPVSCQANQPSVL